MCHDDALYKFTFYLLTYLLTARDRTLDDAIAKNETDVQILRNPQPSTM